MAAAYRLRLSWQSLAGRKDPGEERTTLPDRNAYEPLAPGGTKAARLLRHVPVVVQPGFLEAGAVQNHVRVDP